MDKISVLPKFILHDILSRLPEEDVARTSVLSKTWYDIWSTFPILVFRSIIQGIFLRYSHRENPHVIQEYRRKLNNFLTYVDSSLQRFHDRGFAIKELNLSMMLFYSQYDPQSLSTCIDHWMKIASESGIKVLKLGVNHRDFSKDSLDKYYVLPLSVLETKSLSELELSGKIRVDEAFLNFGIKFSSLQILSLTAVYFGHDQALVNLISSCPMIENLTLNECHGLEVVRIHGLPKLKVAKVFLMKEVDIDTPSIQCLHFGTDYELEFTSKINMAKCSSLRELVLTSVSTIFVTSQWLLELFGKLPLLEKLELDGCLMSERIKVSSARLKVLNLGARVDLGLKEAEIDTPNLESFTYHGRDSKLPAISFLNTSVELEFNIIFDIWLHLDFERLRKFIESIKPTNVLVSVTLSTDHAIIEFNPDALQEISLPSPRIKLLNLYVSPSMEEELCLPLITGLFRSFYPSTISFKPFCSTIFIKILCEKLMRGQEEAGSSGSSQMKCWWHELKNVKVTGCSKKYANIVDCRTLLDSLPSQMHSLPPKDAISFMLEWDSSEVMLRLRTVDSPTRRK